MALLKAIELPSGLTVEYWRIESVSVDVLCNTCSCTISVYKDQASRIAGKTSVKSISFSWCGGDSPFDELANIILNPVAVAYGKVKTMPEFVDAIDA
jgi:hypothetical protein